MLEILEEQKLDTQLTLNTPLVPVYGVRKSSVLSSRKSVGNMDDATLEEKRKLEASVLRLALLSFTYRS